MSSIDMFLLDISSKNMSILDITYRGIIKYMIEIVNRKMKNYSLFLQIKYARVEITLISHVKIHM